MKTAVRLIAVTLLCSLSVFGQTENASISGRVTDPSGSAVVGASVQITDVDTGMNLALKTNGSGFYVAPGLSSGRYRVTVSKEGFQTVNVTGIELSVQEYLSKNIELKIGSVSEQVTVVADAVSINTKDATVSTVVDQTYVKNMPLNGRSFQDLILLAPGVTTVTSQENPNNGDYATGLTGEFSVNGQRTEENYFTVDGVSANVGAFPSSLRSGTAATETALGTTQSLASLDELQEFRIQTSTYSAEYGRTPGAQIAAETKSGTNSYHGTASEYLRNDVFDAADYFTDYFEALNPTANPPIKKNAVRQNDFGGTFGGPLTIPHVVNGKDKTFFFVAYEGLRLLQPQPAHVIYVPDTALRSSQPSGSPLAQVLNAFPLQSPNGLDDTVNGDAQFIGTWSNPSSVNTTSVRFDHMIKNNTRLFFRFSNATSFNTLRGINSASSNTKTTPTQRSYTGGATSAFTGRLTNEFRLNVTTNDVREVDFIDNFGGAVPVNLGQLTPYGATSSFEPAFILGGQFMDVYTNQTATHQKQWNVIDTIGLTAGRHQFKFGADYRRFTPVAQGHPGSILLYLSASEVTSNQAAEGLVSDALDQNARYTNYSLFADDSWKATRRLSLSMGLRWEINPATGVTKGRLPYTLQGTDPTNYSLAPRGTPLWHTTWFNFAPRLGAAYMLRDKDSWQTVVRGGGGLFFDTGQQLGGLAFFGPGTSSSTLAFGPDFGGPSLSFPNDLPPLPPIIDPPTLANGGLPVFSLSGYYPHLQLPYTIEWNASIEQALGKSQTITLSAVGSHAGRLMQETNLHVPTDSSGNSLNPNVFSGGVFYLALNGLTSDYDSLQAQFQRRLSHGLTALASYTWSHCLDYGSFNFFIGWSRGSCDEDVRHNLSAAFSYDLPHLHRGGFLNAIVGHWGVDDRIMARTGFPVDLSGRGTFDPISGRNLGQGVDFVPGQPVYIYGTNCQAVYSSIETNISVAGGGPPVTAPPCPSGRAINPNAFITDTSGGLGAVPRNFVRALGAWQMNLAVRREFPIYENLKLQFRAEAFNVFNHPNFGWVDGGCGDPNPTIGPGCTSPTFGQTQLTLANSIGGLASLYQMGGSRSMQFALKLVF